MEQTDSHGTRQPRTTPVGPAELLAAYEAMSTGRVVVDAEGRVVRANRAAVELAGGELPEGEAVDGVLKCQPPVDWTSTRPVTGTGVLGTAQRAVTVRRLEVLDAELDLGWTVVELVDAVSGPPRREPPASLRSMAVLSVQDAIVVTDAHGFVMYSNDRYAAVNEHHYGRPLTPGECAYDVLSAHPRSLLGALASVEATLAGQSQLFVAPADDPRAEDVTWFETHFDPAVVDGETFAVAVIQDVTEREHDRRRLDEALEAARRASHAKSELLSRMSHELRTPLNAILGFSQLLGAETTGRQREQLGHITDAGRHLLGLVNEVLDVARLEAGHLSLSLEPVDVPAVCREVVVLMTPLAAERGVVLALDADDHAWALGDAQRIKQVLLNLVGNALKYAADGRWCSVEVTTTPDGAVEVVVRDRGPGVEPDALHRLFAPFDRLGADLVDQDGSGLGMALARGFAEAMGGRLTVASEVGTGSAFTMTLPGSTARPARAGEAVDGLVPPARRLRVLLADGDELGRQAPSLLLERAGHTVDAVASGDEAVAAARATAYDVVLLDDESGGLEAAAAIRADAAGAEPTVLLLSFASRTGLPAGAAVDGVLPKPVSRDAVAALG